MKENGKRLVGSWLFWPDLNNHSAAYPIKSMDCGITDSLLVENYVDHNNKQT